MKFFKTFTTVFFFFLFQHFIFGTHIVGGEMTYKCLGNSEYEFELTMYRDCYSGGASFDSDNLSTILGTVTIFSGTTQIDVIALDEPKVSKISFEEFNICETPLNICVEKGVYTFRKILPKSNESYTISYQRCCKTEDVVNIVNSRETGSTFTIEILPAAQNGCHSSPVFSSLPDFLGYVNTELSVSVAVESEGDNLVYSFCAPFIGAGYDGVSGGDPFGVTGVAPNPETPPPYNTLSYQSTYSAGQPLGETSTIEINSKTGLITGLPTIIGDFVVGVCVEEYSEEGILLSRVVREFQYTIIDCKFVASEDILDNTLVELYPNPSADYTIIQMDLKERKNVSVELFDLTGKEISTINYGEKIGTQKLEYDCSILATGIYGMKIQIGDTQVIKKMSVLR